MIIVIAGIKRSFSTGQFNLVRIAMSQAGYKTHNQTGQYSIRDSDDVDIIKMHPFRKDLADKADYIFTTDRRSKDIQASLDRFYDNSGQYMPLYVMRAWLGRWRGYPHLNQHYSLWGLDPLEYTHQIVDYLGVDADPKEVLAEFVTISPPKTGYDPETFLFHNHITSE